jgi:hypothetical protein
VDKMIFRCPKGHKSTSRLRERATYE